MFARNHSFVHRLPTMNSKPPVPLLPAAILAMALIEEHTVPNRSLLGGLSATKTAFHRTTHL